MKKNFLVLVFSLCLFIGASFAEGFDNLSNLTPVQKQKLSQIQFDFKQKNNDLENKLSLYQDKLNQVKADTTRTKEQIALLVSSYERNISVFKAQQDVLKKETDALYKAVMTPEQFLQYQAQQLKVDNAFSNFLQK